MSSQNSTIVRPPDKASPSALSAPTAVEPLPHKPPRRAGAPVRWSFRLLDMPCPSLSARVVEHLWFRLPTGPGADARRRATPPGGRTFTLTRDSLQVRGLVYGPAAAPTAHLVHGWAGWWQQLAAFVDPLLAAGYRVVVHDAPSHGDSPAGRYGARSSRVMEIADAYAAVTEEHGPADLVVAHSIGAMATMWARDRGTAAGAYVFLSAAASVDPMIGHFRHLLGLRPRTVEHVVRRVERRIGHPFRAFDVPAKAAALRSSAIAPPLLAIHDRHDRMLPAQGSADIAEAWPGSELHLTDGLGHRRLLRDEAVVSQVVGFAARHRPPARDERGDAGGGAGLSDTG